MQRKDDLNDFLSSFSKGFAELKKNSQVLDQQRTPVQPKIAKIKAEKTNSFALLSNEKIQNIRNAVAKVCDTAESKTLIEKYPGLWELINHINQSTQNIESCDLPTDSAKTADSVFVVQTEANQILKEKNKSWLNKIIEVTSLAEKLFAGNCMEKAFCAFTALFSNLKKQNIPYSARLAYFDNHFVLIINEIFLMDPWLNFVFPLPEEKNKQAQVINSVFKDFGNLVNYFSIEKNGKCYTYAIDDGIPDIKTYDAASTKEVNSLLVKLNDDVDLVEEKSLVQHPDKKRKSPETVSKSFNLYQPPLKYGLIEEDRTEFKSIFDRQ